MRATAPPKRTANKSRLMAASTIGERRINERPCSASLRLGRCSSATGAIPGRYLMPWVRGIASIADAPAARYATDGSMLYRNPASAGPTIALEVNVAVHNAITLGRSSAVAINGRMARRLGLISASAIPIPTATSTRIETEVEPDLLNQTSTATEINRRRRNPLVTCRRSNRSAMYPLGNASTSPGMN